MMNPSLHKLSTFPLGVALAAMLAVLCTSCADEGPKPWALRPITQDYTFPARDEAGKVLPDGWTVSAADLNMGRRSFVHYCHACHGMNGDGKGPSSYGLRPPPRDFRVASFKFAAVRSGELPNDDDLMRIVKGGLHGTPMLAWDIPDEELWRIIQFIKTFPQAPCDPVKSGKAKCDAEAAEFPDGKPSKWLNTYTKGSKKGQPKPTGDPVVITEDPWQGKATEAIQAGADLYHAKAQCANCHPSYLTKKEFYEASLRLDKEHPITSFREGMYGSIVLAAKDNPYGVNIMPPDFTLNPLRSIRDGEELGDLYRLIGSGVGGVMPAWVDGLKQEDLWAIAHYIHSLQQLAQPTNRAELAKLRDKLANQPPWLPPNKEPKKVTVGVSLEGKLTLDGEAVEDNAALTAKLTKLAEGGQPVEATIEAEAEVKQEDIVAVLEVIKSAGVDKVAINQPSSDDDEDEGDDDGEQGGEAPAPAPEPTPDPKAPAPSPAPKAPAPAPKAPAPKAPAPKAPAPKAPAPKAPPPSDTPYD